MFHTPPYSLQPVSLQECYENFGKTNIRVSRHDIEQKSPLLHHHTHDVTITNSSVSPNDKGERPVYPKILKQNGSPGTLDRKNRRYSHTSGRQNITPSPHEVPYSRLLDSPSNANRSSAAKEMYELKTSPIPTPRHDSDMRLLTPKSLRIPSTKASVSESKLTGEYFQGSEISVK